MKQGLYILAFLAMFTIGMKAQDVYPMADGERIEYSAQIEFQGNGISGMLILKKEGEKIVGTLMNEFGIRAFDMIVDTRQGKMKVKLKDMMALLNKWYIRRVLKRDLRQMFLRNVLEYENKKYGIIYKFTRL